MPPTPEPFLQLGLAAGFVFAAAILSWILWTLFQSWRKGDFVSRPIHEEALAASKTREDRLIQENAELRGQVVSQGQELARLAQAFERLSYRSSQDRRR